MSGSGAQLRPCVEVIVPTGPDGLEAVLGPLAAAIDGTGPAIALVPRDGPPEYVQRIRAAVRPGEPVPAEVAVVAGTSGSTGSPSGVLLPATALRSAARAFAQRCVVTAHTWVAGLPLHHAGGLMVAVRAVVGGGPVRAMGSLGGAEPFTAVGFVSATDDAWAASASRLAGPPTSAEDPGGGPLAVSLVPAMLATLAHDPAGVQALRRYDAVLVGGAGTPPDLVARMRAAGVRLRLSYGMTETCGGAVFDGRPLAGMTVTATPEGRLRLAGDQVAAGYRDGRRPERWGIDEKGRRWFRTDDLGTVSDGHVRVLGRADDVVQVGGASVSLGAVADVLRADPRVAAAEVVDLPDERLGARIVALVVPVRGACQLHPPDTARPDTEGGPPGPTGGPPPLAGSLAARVVDALGGPARPRRIRLVKQLPLLGSGKADRPALRALAEEAPPV
jgi:o-succinylbenzoate---CoA ligase